MKLMCISLDWSYFIPLTGKMDGNIFINNSILGLVEMLGFFIGLCVGKMKRKSLFFAASAVTAAASAAISALSGKSQV